MLYRKIRLFLLSVLPVLFCTCNGCDMSLLSGTTYINPASEINCPLFIDSTKIAYIKCRYEIREIRGGIGEWVRNEENFRYSLVIRDIFTGIPDTEFVFPAVSPNNLRPFLSYYPPVLLLSSAPTSSGSVEAWYYNFKTRTAGTYPGGYLSLAGSPDTAYSVRSICSLPEKTSFFNFPDSVMQIHYYNAKTNSAILYVYSDSSPFQERSSYRFAACDPQSGTFSTQKMSLAVTGKIIDNSRYFLFAAYDTDTSFHIVPTDSLDASLTHRRPIGFPMDYSDLPCDVSIGNEMVLWLADTCCHISNFDGETVAGPFCP